MNKIQKIITVPIVGGIMVLGGAAASYATLAFAQTDTGSSTQTTISDTDAQSRPRLPQHDPSKGGHNANGITEQILTGDTAANVTAAAQAAQPGATIERVETDAEGATYEAHMTKADGSHVTLKFDANYNVTGTEDGPSGARR